jgi:hypothetical protein
MTLVVLDLTLDPQASSDFDITMELGETSGALMVHIPFLLVIVDLLSRVVAPKGGDSIFILDWWVLRYGEELPFVVLAAL